MKTSTKLIIVILLLALSMVLTKIVWTSDIPQWLKIWLIA